MLEGSQRSQEQQDLQPAIGRNISMKRMAMMAAALVAMTLAAFKLNYYQNFNQIE